MRQPKSPMKHPERYLTIEDAERIIDAARSDHRTYVLFFTLLRTGARTSEIVRGGYKGVKCFGLRKRDLDFDKNLIFLTTLKKPDRPKEPIEVDMETMKLLRDYVESLQIGEADFIFPISRERVWQLMKKYGRRSGVSEWKLHPHIFRHSHAIHVANTLKNPAGLEDLRKRLRHSDISITAYYLRFKKSDDSWINEVWKKENEQRLSVEEFRKDTSIVARKAGVYILYDNEGVPLYVGRAVDLRLRLWQHLVKLVDGIDRRDRGSYTLRINIEIYKNPELVRDILLVFDYDSENKYIGKLRPKFNNLGVEGWEIEAMIQKIPPHNFEVFREEYEKRASERMREVIDK